MNLISYVTVRVTPEVSIIINGGTIEQMAALMSSLESHCDCLRNGIHSVLTDENFTIGSSKAKAAVDCAKSMIQWSAKQENERNLRRFAEWLVKGLESCLDSAATKSNFTSQKKRELMWKALSSSDTFRKRWESFISHSVSTSPCPIFYQYVTDIIFKNMTKERFPISAPQTVENPESLNYIEKNVLRYAAGCIKKLQSLSILTRKSCCCTWMIWCKVRQRV